MIRPAALCATVATEGEGERERESSLSLKAAETTGCTINGTIFGRFCDVKS